MTQRQDPAEQLLDVLVYAPLGLAMEAAELLPRLADKGRRRVGGKVTVARMVGELAVRQGQRQAEKFVERMRDQQRRARTARPTPPDATRENGHDPAPGRGPAAGFATAPPSPSSARPPAAARPPGAAAADAADLAIPGFDTLSASQVVPRLEGLSSDELEAVRSYEETHRARKTVLTRIDQLRDSAS